MKPNKKAHEFMHVDKRTLAIHESAHAVFVIGGGRSVKRISILFGRCGNSPNGFSVGHCFTPFSISKQTNTSEEAVGIVRGLLAGGIAEMLLLDGDKESVMSGGASSDFQTARDICSSFNLDEDLIMREMFIDVQLKRDAILGMADELIRKGRLDERDILKTYRKFVET